MSQPSSTSPLSPLSPLAAPLPHSAPQVSKRAIAAHRVLHVDDLSDEDRRRLGPALYGVFSLSYGALDLDTVCEEIIFKPGGRLALYRDAADALVGFSTLKISLVQVGKRKRAILESGAYFVPGVRGGSKAAWFGVQQAIQFKLRHPGTPLACLCESLTPATYRRLTRTLPEVWPSRHAPTPPDYAELLNTVLDDRGFDRAADRPFVIRYDDPAAHRNLDNLNRSESLNGDPDAQFYRAANPDFADGDVLCCIAPMNLPQLAVAVAGHVTKTLRRILP